jgi:Na+-transporting methylmalonyl-CoA/oxaloacetate decarboxylase gamma subunit
MVTNTFLGIIFVPLFFVLVTWLFSAKARRMERAEREEKRISQVIREVAGAKHR